VGLFFIGAYFAIKRPVKPVKSQLTCPAGNGAFWNKAARTISREGAKEAKERKFCRLRSLRLFAEHLKKYHYRAASQPIKTPGLHCILFFCDRASPALQEL
jgi:hypothetical protein